MFSDLRRYDQYVATGIDWLPSRPAHWEVSRGMRFLKPAKAKNADLAEPTVLSLSFGRIVVKPQEKLHGLVPASFASYQVLDPGAIVIRPTDLQNDQRSARVGLVRDRGIITSAYLGFTIVGGITSDYAFGYLSALDSLKVFYGMGSGLRQNLEWADFKRLPMLLPPCDEQTKIVRYLAHANRRIDQAIAAKRKMIRLLEEQKQVIVSEAVTRGFDPHVPMKDSGIPSLGEIPSHWELARAKDVCTAIVDCKNRTPQFVAGGDYIVVRTSCIRAGRFSLEGSYTTDAANFRTWTERGAPQLGDVFFTREAPAGQAALVPDRTDLCMGQRMMYFRPDPVSLDSSFLLHSIYGPMGSQHVTLATNGSTVGHLRLGDVTAFPILLPPLQEQQRIVERIAEETSPIEAILTRTTDEIALLREFRTRLTSDVVTGQVDVRGIAASLPDVSLDELAEAVDGSLDDELDELAEEFVEDAALV